MHGTVGHLQAICHLPIALQRGLVGPESSRPPVSLLRLVAELHLSSGGGAGRWPLRGISVPAARRSSPLWERRVARGTSPKGSLGARLPCPQLLWDCLQPRVQILALLRFWVQKAF